MNTYIIATGPHGFAGAGRILSENLIALSNIGYQTVFVALKTPFLFRSRDNHGVRLEIPKLVRSNAIGNESAIFSQDVLVPEILAETIAEIALSQSSDKNIILWGTYLHPYGAATLLAKSLLKERGVDVKVWITPTGSDIWEVGPQLFNISKYIVNSSQVSKIITYSSTFAEEILQLFSIHRNITIIPPIVDFTRFYPLTTQQKVERKLQLQIDINSFLLTSHSNMRPVKHPEDVIYICSQFANQSNRHVILFMMGPKVELGDLAISENLSVVWTGILSNVELYLQISDVEINCSHHDSFNLSLAEAMACGVPCLSTNVVGIGPIIEVAQCGLLFPYIKGNSESRLGVYYQDAVSFLDLISKDEALHSKLGKNAVKFAIDYFSMQKIIDSYNEIIEAT